MKPLLCLSCFLMLAGSAFAKHPESPAQTLAERAIRFLPSTVVLYEAGLQEPAGFICWFLLKDLRAADPVVHDCSDQYSSVSG